MNRPHTAMSQFEATALLQVRMRAQIDAEHRAAAQRLIHAGLITEGPAGFRVTAAGEVRVREQARRRGLSMDTARQ